MSWKRFALIVLPVAAVALTAAPAVRPIPPKRTSALAGQPADARKVSLAHYFSGMSRPVRISVLRVTSLTRAIDGFLSHGDPPFRRQIAGACRHLRAEAADGRFFGGTPPRRLEASHRSLSQVFSAVRTGCEEARHTALTLDAAGARFARTGSPEDKAKYERADAAAHKSLPRFARTTVRPFIRAMRTWRSTALRYAAALAVRPPRWLRRLPV